MGMVFGKITVETPKYQILKSAATYEIRKYPPAVIAQYTYDPSQMKGDKDGGFQVLAGYIGAIGSPQNTKPEKIAMTAPVITSSEAEKIAMTAPVITSSEAEKIAMTAPVITSSEPEKIAMTAPVFTNSEEDKKMVTMQFILPSKYSTAEEAPKPTDDRVVIKEVGEKIYGVLKFSGLATDSVVEEKVRKLKECLEKDGYKIIGEFVLARYNPPFTLPPLRTNEVMIPVELVE
ncbi:hypothetical protein ACHQM5_002821 [Ranunculus cassubicifolius]